MKKTLPAASLFVLAGANLTSACEFEPQEMHARSTVLCVDAQTGQNKSDFGVFLLEGVSIAASGLKTSEGNSVCAHQFEVPKSSLSASSLIEMQAAEVTHPDWQSWYRKSTPIHHVGAKKTLISCKGAQVGHHFGLNSMWPIWSMWFSAKVHNF